MSVFRIYADESGTQSNEWLVIGMLFVPDHGPLHSALCDVKENLKYYNNSPKKQARYKETHLAEFRHNRDVEVGRKWIDLFLGHDCYYRCVVVDWSIWKGKYFGSAFDPEALEKRRAYKKWAEMLLQFELKLPDGRPRFLNARFYLDRLRILYGYDVIDHLRERFTGGYQGQNPYINEFQHTESWKDANQCLQLCDLLTGCMYQSLVTAQKPVKQQIRQYLEDSLKPLGIKNLSASFWRGYAANTLTEHFPKFSAWFWKPAEKKKKKWR